MRSLGLESLLAWRYLLRAELRPRPLFWGLGLLALGALALFTASYLDRWDAEWSQEAWALERWGNSYLAERALGGIAQGIQVTGISLVALGVSQSLFGVLYLSFTPFAAFSTFMVAIGVAEVILVLAVMNGFQGFLREKLVDASAHITMEAAGDERLISDYQALAAEAREVEGVLGVSPVLSEEVMLRRTGASGAEAAILFGVRGSDIGETVGLQRFLELGCGCLGWLERPALLHEHLARIPARTTDRFCRCDDERLSALGPSSDPPARSRITGGERAPSMMALPPPRRRSGAPALFLGQHLHTRLGLRPGDQLEVIVPLGELGPTGPIPRLSRFLSAGWLASGLAEVDNQHGYSSLETLQRLLKSGDRVSSLRIRVASLDATRPVRDRLQERFAGRLEVSDWRERNQGLFSALKLERIAMFLVLTINILLAAFSIVSTLMMNLLERRREIAILSASGAARRMIAGLFVRQGLFAGGLGALLGTGVGVGGALAIAAVRLPRDAQEIYYISSIPVELRVGDVLAIVTVAFVVTLIATLYPAYHAASLAPVEGLKGK